MKSESGDDKKSTTPPAGSKSEDKKPGFDAEKIILKMQNTINEVIVPKLKDFYAMSKAAFAGAVKGVKEMKKDTDKPEDKNKQ